MEYVDFKEKRDKEIYVSKVAEYKRNIQNTKSFFVGQKSDTVFNFLKKEILQKDTGDIIFEGYEISEERSKKKAFMTIFDEGKKIGFEELRPDGFYKTAYYIKPTRNGGTKIKITYGMKLLNRTRTGLNGQLGSMMWKWATLKLLNKSKTYIVEKLNNKEKSNS